MCDTCSSDACFLRCGCAGSTGRAVAATADQTDDVQNAAETSAEDSAQNADSDDLEGSIQYLDDSAPDKQF